LDFPKGTPLTVGVSAPNTTLNTAEYPTGTVLLKNPDGKTVSLTVLGGDNGLTVAVNMAVPPEGWTIVSIPAGGNPTPLLNVPAGTPAAVVRVNGV
jgi:hypothetical protein